MILPPKIIHPKGEAEFIPQKSEISALIADTFSGKIHIEWDPQSEVTPFGQLPFFTQYLKIGGLLMPWVDDCPLHYTSPNAPSKLNLLGSFLLSILAGHTRYAHITRIQGDNVNAGLLGMSKVVGEDSARRGLKRIDVEEGISWMRKHLYHSYGPLLGLPWILDVDVTVKPLYGHQEGAVVGYNPHKPGRPSHTYHTYMIANLRLILEVEVQAGNKSSSTYTAPGLWNLLDRIPRDHWPAFIRGDSDWGSDTIMTESEQRGIDYLFKLKKSPLVKQLIHQHHCKSGWVKTHENFEAYATELKLLTWKKARRVIIVRRRLPRKSAMTPDESTQALPQQLSLIEPAEPLTSFEYNVLITSLDDEVITIVQHYRDRADCENNFDEIKNQWGWCGFVTQKLTPCRLIARMIALIYNWWTLFVRLIEPEKHYEAIVSRPLLLYGVGKQTHHAGKTTLTITSNHGRETYIREAYTRVCAFFDDLRAIAPQLTPLQCWYRILSEAMKKYLKGVLLKPPELITFAK